VRTRRLPLVVRYAEVHHAASLTALVCCALVALGAPARAQESAEDDATRARQLFEEGVAALHAEDLERAAIVFGQSLDLRPHVATAFNLAGALRDLGRQTAAVAVYDGLLEGSYGDLSEEQRAEVDEMRGVALAATAILEVRVEGADAAAVTVDDVPIGEARRGAPLAHRHDAGYRVVRARTDDGREAMRRLSLGAGATEAVELVLPSPVMAEVEPARSEPVLRHADEPRTEREMTSGGVSAWVWVVAAVAVVAATTIGVVLLADGEGEPTVDPVLGHHYTLSWETP